MTDTTKRLGYGGSAEIDGIQVLITAGSMEDANAISYLEAFDITPVVGVSRSRMTHADGTVVHTGTVSFDVTEEFLVALTTARLLARGYRFAVGIDDGEDAFEMTSCLVTSLSLSGAAGGLINASLSFMAPTKRAASIAVDNNFIRDQVPLGYWWSGNVDVRDWTLTMNQNVSPVYINEDSIEPKYLRFGLFDFGLAVTTFDAVQPHNSISVATSTFTLKGNTASEGYTYGGVTELGMYSHQFDTAADITIGSGDTVIT